MKPSQFLIEGHKKMHEAFDRKFVDKEDAKLFFDTEYLPYLELIPKNLIKCEIMKRIKVDGNEVRLIIENSIKLREFLKSIGINYEELLKEKKLEIE